MLREAMILPWSWVGHSGLRKNNTTVSKFPMPITMPIVLTGANGEKNCAENIKRNVSWCSSVFSFCSFVSVTMISINPCVLHCIVLYCILVDSSSTIVLLAMALSFEVTSPPSFQASNVRWSWFRDFERQCHCEKDRSTAQSIVCVVRNDHDRWQTKSEYCLSRVQHQ